MLGPTGAAVLDFANGHQKKSQQKGNEVEAARPQDRNIRENGETSEEVGENKTHREEGKEKEGLG
jgi:hypothetical protein